MRIRFKHILGCLVFLLSIEATRGQNLLVNGSFENLNQKYYKDGKPSLCDKQAHWEYLDDVYLIRPDTPYIYRTYYAFVMPPRCEGYHCKASDGNLFLQIDHGSAVSSYGREVTIKTALALPLHVNFVLSIDASVGDSVVTKKGWVSPSVKNNSLGYALSVKKPWMKDGGRAEFVPDSAVQIPFMLDKPGWHKVKWEFSSDSAYEYLSFGSFIANYKASFNYFYSKIPRDPDSASYSAQWGVYIDNAELFVKTENKPDIQGLSEVCQGVKNNWINSNGEIVAWYINDSLVAIDSQLLWVSSNSFTIKGVSDLGKDSIVVIVKEKPKIPLVTQDKLWCHNQIKLTSNRTGMSNIWFPDNKPDSFLFITDTIRRTLINYGVNGCNDSSYYNIKALCPPKLLLQYKGCIGDSILIENLEHMPIKWYLNGNFIKEGVSIKLRISSSEIRISAVNVLDSVSSSIVLDSFCSLIFIIPNSFTPNGDNLNDKFEVVNYGKIKEYALRVFSRWGQVVFETNNVLDFWDGNFQELPLPTGIYIYSLKATDFRQKNYSKSGEVMLLR